MEQNKSYSLKKKKLKRWIYEHDHTQPFVARKLGMSVKDMKDNLKNQKRFTRKQIKSLVYLMGAQEAFKVIYFPSLEERKRVYQETFQIKEGKYNKEERKHQ